MTILILRYIGIGRESCYVAFFKLGTDLSFYFTSFWGNHTTLVGWSAPSHYLNQCWNIVNWNLTNKLQLNLKRNSYIFIQENAFENVCEMAAILSRPKCVSPPRGGPVYIRYQNVVTTLACRWLGIKRRLPISKHISMISDYTDNICRPGDVIQNDWRNREIPIASVYAIDMTGSGVPQSCNECTVLIQ